MIDLLIAGGGPVGLATAIYAQRAGLSVVVAEPRAGAVDKACGEGLMPGAVSALHELGISPPGRLLRGIHYTDGRRAATAAFSSGPGLGVRRPVLHQSLRDAAASCGIEVLPVRVDTIGVEPNMVRAGGMTARYLVAADGLHSPIRRLAGLHQPARGPKRFGVRRHFAVAPWSDYVEVHWGRDCEAYITPVADDLVGVAVLTQERGRYEQHLRAFPALLDRLPTDAATRTRAAGPLRQRSRARTRGRLLLVGDAAGYVDALTGEGIAVGLASAKALVSCIVADDPAAYELAWLQATRRCRRFTESLLWVRNRPPLARAIVPVASRLPALFGFAVDQLAR